MSLCVERPEGLRPVSRQTGRRKFGVPDGGPFDTVSARLANALLGLDKNAPLYELTLFGGVFGAETDQIVSVVGAPCHVNVGYGDGPGDRAFRLPAGRTLRVSGTGVGARVYLASRAWTHPERSDLRLADSPPSIAEGPLKLLPGPASSLVTMADLTAAKWTVSLDSDRVGIRCQGPVIGDGRELPSEPACLGAVQLTPSGTLLIVGPDGPTLGGYPKIGVVATVDHDRLAQLRPGAPIRFELVTLDEARRALAERETAVASFERLIRWRAGWN